MTGGREVKSPALDVELRRGRLPEAENALNEILDLIADAVADRLLDEVRAEELAAAGDGPSAISAHATAPPPTQMGDAR